MSFEQCQFVHCRFAGPLRQVVFDGSEHPERPGAGPMVAVDFRDAVFDDVDFYGYDLDGTVTFPDDPDVRVIRFFRQALERALPLLEGDPSREARMLRAEFSGRLRRRGTLDESNVFNRRDYERSGGAVLADLAERVLTGTGR